MQLFCSNSQVVAWHDDGQSIPADAYPGCTLINYAGGLDSLTRIGTAPPRVPGVPYSDTRPYAAPAIDLTAYAASARYAKETGGITVNGMAVATDRGSQALITGAWATVQMNPQATIQWKASDGSFVSLNAAAITALATAVTNHVQACFAAEATIGQGIAAATIKTPADVDKAFAAVTG